MEANRVVQPLDWVIQNIVLKIPYLREQGILHNIPYIVGDPGSGKSAMMAAMTAQAGFGFIPRTPALEREERFGGIPETKFKQGNDGEELHTLWSIPELITNIREVAAKNKHTIVLLDDWHLCDAGLQSIGYELFTYYSLNGYKIPQNVTICLAGNEKSTAGAKTQLTAIRGRCQIYYTKPSIQYWMNNFAIPTKLNSVGITFFSEPENEIYFVEEESTTSQFGSARSWTSFLNMLNLIEDGKIQCAKSDIFGIAQANVGVKCAEKFMIYYDIVRKLKLNELFDKGYVEIPKDNVSRFAYFTELVQKYVNRYIERESKQNRVKRSNEDNIEEYFCKAIIEGLKECKEVVIRSIRFLGEYPQIEELKVSGSNLLIGIITDKNGKKRLPPEVTKELANIRKDIYGINHG